MVGYSTSREVYVALERLFTTKFHARIIQLRYQLSTISKGSSSITYYYSKVKYLSDTMSVVGSPLSSFEFISYLLASLNNDFDAFVTSVISRLEPFTQEELYALLPTHENCISHSNHLPYFTDFINFSTNFIANSSHCGRGCTHKLPFCGGYCGRGRGHSPYGPLPSFSSSSIPHNKHTCQFVGNLSTLLFGVTIILIIHAK